MQMTRNSSVSHRGNVLCHTYVRGDAKKVVEVGCSHEGTLPKGNVVIEGITIQSAKDVTCDHIEPHGSTVVDPSGESRRRPRLHRGGHGISTTLWYSGWNSPISKTALPKNESLAQNYCGFQLSFSSGEAHLKPLVNEIASKLDSEATKGVYEIVMEDAIKNPVILDYSLNV